METTDQSVHPECASPVFRYGPWTWREPMRGEHFRRCSFCGSIHPEDLAAETGWRAEWADRKYGWPHKFYVDIPNRDPAALFIISSQLVGDGDRPDDRLGLQWHHWDELPAGLRAIAERDGWGGDRDWHPDWLGFGTRANHHAKFYSIHLSDSAVSAEAKAAIEQRSGLQFTFTEDGRVAWSPAPNWEG